jgi:hypothetical protein
MVLEVPSVISAIFTGVHRDKNSLIGYIARIVIGAIVVCRSHTVRCPGDASVIRIEDQVGRAVIVDGRDGARWTFHHGEDEAIQECAVVEIRSGIP